MNVRPGLFRLRSLFGLGDPLLREADDLVQVAEMNATVMFESLLKKFSFLREVDLKRWEFIVTIASVFIAIVRLQELGLGENRQQKLMERVGAKLIQWNPTNGRRRFENCASFYEKAFNELTSVSEPQFVGSDALGSWTSVSGPQFVGSDALGSWVVWSVLSRPAQSEEEHRLVRVVGGMVTHTYFKWLEEKS
jgi:hypothetical protein